LFNDDSNITQFFDKNKEIVYLIRINVRFIDILKTLEVFNSLIIKSKKIKK